jgi:hypothetical protein
MMHRTATWTWLGLSLLVMGWHTPLRSDEPLRWKLKAGEALRYGFQQRSQAETTSAGKSTVVALEMSMQLAWLVDEVDTQGTATLTQSIEQLAVLMQVDSLTPVRYDSSEPAPASGPGKEIAEGVAALIGGKYQVKLTARGEILSVELSESLRKMLEGTKSGDLFTPEGLSRIVRQSSVVLPEPTVGAGDTWETTQDQSTPLGGLHVVTRYTHGGKDEMAGRSCEKITSTASIQLQPAPGAAMPTTLKESAQTGTIWFDAAAGRFVKSALQQKLVTERKYRERALRVSTTTTMEMKLLEAASPAAAVKP